MNRAAGIRLSLLLVLVLAAVLVPSLVLKGSQNRAKVPAKAMGFDAYAPGPEENNSLASLEQFMHDRNTYPTGNFDPSWLLKAKREARLVRSGVPAGARPSVQTDSAKAALALSTTMATFLGPQPQESDPLVCNGLCFSFGRVGGRVNAIALDPTTTTPGLMTAYFGADGGGVWKSTNCCDAATLWTVTTDAPNVTTTAIDDLFVDPTNRWVYAATGDISFGSFAFGSAGILRSKDQGATWEVLAAGQFGPALPVPPFPNNYPQYQAISKVKVDPNNNQNIIAATKTGLYFSYDQGTSFTGPCFTNSFSDQRQDVTDLLVTDDGTGAVQGEATTLYAAIGTRGFPTSVQPDLGKNGANGIYKATMPASGCPSWTALTSGWPSGTASGVPCDPPRTPPTATTPNCPTTTNRLGRIEMAFAPSTLNDGNPNNDTIYAEVQAVDIHGPEALHGNTPCGVLQRLPLVSSPGRSRGCFFGLFRTNDSGATWTQQSDQHDLFNIATAGPCGEDTPQNWYNQGLAVDPTDPEVLFMDAIDVWKSTDGGVTLTDISCGYYTGLITNHLHVDNHALLYAPPIAGVANTLLAGNDGGIYVSNTATNNPVITLIDPTPSNPGALISGVPTFTEINNSVGTIEFYGGDISPNFANSATPFIVGGSQDNGSASFQWANSAAIGCVTSPVPAGCNWQQRIGGDGMHARIEQKQGLRVYMESQNGNIRVSQTGHAGVYSGTVPLVATSPSWPWNGDARSFIFPYELDKHDCVTNNPGTTCDHIIAGSYRVWESITTGGSSNVGAAVGWYPASGNLTKSALGSQCPNPPPADCRSFINQLMYAPQDNRVAIVGTNDGNVQYGFNLGTGTPSLTVTCVTCVWVNVTGGNTILPNRPIMDVAISPADKLVGYAAVGGFNENTPGTPGHVFRVTCTADCGSFTWEDKTGNLPNIPHNAIIANPRFPSQVFVGTDWGLYFTNNINDANPTWTHFTNGLPNTMIWDLVVDRGPDPQPNATALAIFTRGRSAFGLALAAGPTAATVTTFTGRAVGPKTVRLSWRTGRETDVLGFNIWRFAGGKGVKVNRTLISAKAKGARGAAYSLVDRTARRGKTYTYRLQVVNRNGKRNFQAGTVVRVRR
jgi:hypothetical protein